MRVAPAIRLPLIAAVLLAICLAMPIATSGQGLATDRRFTARPSPNRPIALPSFSQIGTHGCEQCHKHGHEYPDHAVEGREYAIWLNQDRHSCAYNILFEKQSLAIAQNLKLKVPPHQNTLCLNCHSNKILDSAFSHEQVSRVDGVGCESCHGAAEAWLVPHKLPQWQSLTGQDKERYGFRNLDNLAVRARKCAECHVGSPGRDVNHDLIAAGHPRLYFEFAAYQAKQPRHWSRTKELNQHSPLLEARTWLIGQFVSAESSLAVLQQRAENTKAPWPEFGEYGCFACHQELADERWKDPIDVFKKGHGDRKPKWGTWHLSIFDAIPVELSFGSTETTADLERLRQLMEKGLPDRNTAAQLAASLRQQFAAVADQLAEENFDPLVVTQIANALRSSDPTDSGDAWESLTQRYLAIVAMRQSILDGGLLNHLPSFDAVGSKTRLLAARNSLRFKDGRNGPIKLTDEQIAAIGRVLRSAVPADP